MTTAEFWNIVINQKVWRDMYRIQQDNKKDEYQNKCRVYQEIKRRERGAPIRAKNALFHY